MHRIGYVYEKIVDLENLRIASKKACSTRKNKIEVAEYKQNEEENLIRLRMSLINGTYRSSEYRMFTLYEHGKKRIIADLPLYPDRILHWAICLITEPIINQRLIDQTYASVPGRGYHQAVHQIQRYLQSDNKLQYSLTFDVKQCYPSFPKDRLVDKLSKVFKDEAFLKLMERLIMEYPHPGLPIGNRYSPMLANLYLSDLDHILKEKYHCHYLVAFMDDRWIGGYSKQWLHRIRRIAESILNEIGLQMKGNYKIAPVSIGIHFLGHCIYPTHIRLSRYTRTKLKRATYRLTDKEIDLHDIGTIASYHGVLKWTDGINLEKHTIGPYYKQYIIDKHNSA